MVRTMTFPLLNVHYLNRSNSLAYVGFFSADVVTFVQIITFCAQPVQECLAQGAEVGMFLNTFFQVIQKVLEKNKTQNDQSLHSVRFSFNGLTLLGRFIELFALGEDLLFNGLQFIQMRLLCFMGAPQTLVFDLRFLLFNPARKDIDNLFKFSPATAELAELRLRVGATDQESFPSLLLIFKFLQQTRMSGYNGVLQVSQEILRSQAIPKMREDQPSFLHSPLILLLRLEGKTFSSPRVSQNYCTYLEPYEFLLQFVNVWRADIYGSFKKSVLALFYPENYVSLFRSYCNNSLMRLRFLHPLFRREFNCLKLFQQSWRSLVSPVFKFTKLSLESSPPGTELLEGPFLLRESMTQAPSRPHPATGQSQSGLLRETRAGPGFGGTVATNAVRTFKSGHPFSHTGNEQPQPAISRVMYVYCLLYRQISRVSAITKQRRQQIHHPICFLQPGFKFISDCVPTPPISYHFFQHALYTSQLHRDILPTLASLTHEAIDVSTFTLVYNPIDNIFGLYSPIFHQTRLRAGRGASFHPSSRRSSHLHEAVELAEKKKKSIH
ncbi:hypothetical protein C0J52_06638 [Blattella germanica]|nr:hypothetical protein C0J52_06638 [Blattella germanica]